MCLDCQNDNTFPDYVGLFWLKVTGKDGESGKGRLGMWVHDGGRNDSTIPEYVGQ